MDEKQIKFLLRSMHFDNGARLLLDRIEGLESMVKWLAEVVLKGVKPTGEIKDFLESLPKYDRSFIREPDREKMPHGLGRE